MEGLDCRLRESKRKNQSYDWFVVEHRGFEPLTSTMRTLRATNCANAPCMRLVWLNQTCEVYYSIPIAGMQGVFM